MWEREFNRMAARYITAVNNCLVYRVAAEGDLAAVLGRYLPGILPGGVLHCQAQANIAIESLRHYLPPF